MLLAVSAWACDDAMLARIPVPVEITAEPEVGHGSFVADDVRFAGARVTYRSAHPVAAWAPVLARPEDQDDWHPGEFGTRRVERLDPTTIYQQLDIRMLFGAVRIRRQTVVGITPLADGPSEIRNCWDILDPEPWRVAIAPYVDDTPFQRHGFGGWQIRALADGGTAVSYSLWADTGAMPAAVQSWAMSRTFPDLMRAFETYVGGARP